MEKKISRKYNTQKLVSGYVDAYDPDYIVIVGDCSASYLTDRSRKIIKSSEIISDNSDAPKYGIGINKILYYFIENELKFTRTKPLDVRVLNFNKKYSLFFFSIFGLLPKCYC